MKTCRLTVPAKAASFSGIIGKADRNQYVDLYADWPSVAIGTAKRRCDRRSAGRESSIFERVPQQKKRLGPINIKNFVLGNYRAYSPHIVRRYVDSCGEYLL
jgi:hypothetical protein